MTDSAGSGHWSHPAKLVASIRKWMSEARAVLSRQPNCFGAKIFSGGVGGGARFQKAVSQRAPGWRARRVNQRDRETAYLFARRGRASTLPPSRSSSK